METPQTMHIKIPKTMTKMWRENSVSRQSVLTGLSEAKSTMRPNGKGVQMKKTQKNQSQAYGGRTEGEVNDNYVTTNVATNNQMQLMNYQQLLATSESSMAQSPFGTVSLPCVTQNQTEGGFIQQDCPHRPVSTGILQSLSSHENQYMVATNQDLQWLNPDDMTMIPSWPFENDMAMIPPWQSEDGMATV
jgi:hypothetical protein